MRERNIIGTNLRSIDLTLSSPVESLSSPWKNKRYFLDQKRYKCETSKIIVHGSINWNQTIIKPITILLFWLMFLNTLFMKLIINRNSEKTLHYSFEAIILLKLNHEGCENETISQGRSYISSSIDISDCSFSRALLYDGDGGVIYLFGGTSTTYNMSIAYSMFFNCSCSGSGGAIYFYSINSIIHASCGYSCSASSYGHFAFLYSGQNNTVDMISVAFCSRISNGNMPINIRKGNQKISRTNCSLNKVFCTSGMYFFQPNSLLGSFCTFSGNRASGGGCLEIYQKIGDIEFSNIVNNNSPINGVVIVYDSASLFFNSCVFDTNQNTLFCNKNGILNVLNSFINHLGKFSTSTPVLTSNNSITKWHTYYISHYSTAYCYSDFPPITHQQTIQNTPEQSLGEQTPFESPLITISQTSTNVFSQTNIETKVNTPNNTPIQTMMRTLSDSAFPTNSILPIKTPYETSGPTIKESPTKSLHPTNYTPENSIPITFDLSSSPTFEKTIMNSIEPTQTNSSSSTVIIIGASVTTTVAMTSLIFFSSKYFHSKNTLQVTINSDS